MTNLESVRLLCQSIIQRLESRKMITVIIEKRQALVDDMTGKIKPQILTQEDQEKQVLESIGEKTEELDALKLSGGEAYRTVRQSWLSKHGEYEVDGLFFQQPIKYIAEWTIQFLFNHDAVEEVYAKDDMLMKTIVSTVGNFRRAKLH